MITTLTLPIRALRCALSVLLLGLALRASATPVAFDIPAQAATEALDLFIKQSGANVVYLQADMQGVATNAVQGTYEPAAALKLLLQNTVLTFTESKPGEFAVGRTKPGSVEGNVQNESGKPVMGARVSLIGTNKAVVTDKRGRFSFEEVPAGPQSLAVTAEGMQNTKVTDVNVKAGHRLTLSTIAIPVAVAGAVQLEDYVVSAKKNTGIIELDPYEVSGRRENAFTTESIDLRRTQDDVLPFQVFTGEEITLSGAPDLAEFFRKRLPQNFNTTIPEEDLLAGNDLRFISTYGLNQLNFSNGAGTNAGALSYGGREIVLLLNGRRLPNQLVGQVTEGGQTTADFRSIPVGSIERIEVLTSSASAIYGAGATGGVINIITRANYTGVVINLGYESPIDTSAPKRSVGFSASIPAAKSARLTLNYSYNDITPLEIGDRLDVTARRLRQTLLARAPSLLWSNSSNIPFGSTPNLGLFSPFTFALEKVTFVPVGSTGNAPASSYQFGVLNLDVPPGRGDSVGRMLGRRSRLGPDYRNERGAVGFEQELYPGWHLNADFSHTRTHYQGAVSPFSQALVVFPGNPISPFPDFFVGAYIFDPNFERPELTNRASTQSDLFTVSLRGAVGEWRLLADATSTQSRSDFFEISAHDTGLGAFSEFQMTNVWQTAIPAGLYNPFVDPMVAAPATPSFYENYRQRRSRQASRSGTKQISLKGSGPIYQLRAGDVQLTTGLEWFRQELLSVEVERSYVRALTGAQEFEIVDDTRFNPFRTDTFAAYAETTVPLLVPNDFRLARSFEVFGSIRTSLQEVKGFRVISANTTSDSSGRRITRIADRAEYTTRPFVSAYGFRWVLPGNIALRVSQSDGFRPPAFFETVASLPPTQSINVNDRRTGQQGVVLTSDKYNSGGNPDLEPETTRATNIGLIFSYGKSDRLRFSVDYVQNVRDSAITSLDPQTVLDGELGDATLAARVRRDANGNIQFVDARNINFRQIESRVLNLGLDFQSRPLFRDGRLGLSLAASRNLSFKVQRSVASSAEEQVRNPLAFYASQFPVAWNGNAAIRWETEVWSVEWASRYFDYVLLAPQYWNAHQSDRIPSAFDNDLSATFRLDRLTKAERPQGWLKNTMVSLGVKNIFDRAPRFDARTQFSGVGYFGADSVAGRTGWIRVRKEF